jgi:SAM-dependent methyltransferase
MNDTETRMSDANNEQIEFWNGTPGARWVTYQETLDRVLGPIGDLAIERAAVTPGEKVIDVGCGCGATTLELAAKVGKSGRVLGVDVSAPMLSRARERAKAHEVGRIELVEADASTHAFPFKADLVFSRFGVMFFRDPVVAFANLRGALRPGGRLVFASWRNKELNAWMGVPMAAAMAVVGAEAPTPPDEPGPFSLSDEARLRAVLGGAGFADKSCDPVDNELLLGEDIESATDFSLHAGPVSRLVLDATDEVRARVREAVVRALKPYAGPRGVVLRAATWMVQARA